MRFQTIKTRQTAMSADRLPATQPIIHSNVGAKMRGLFTRSKTNLRLAAGGLVLAALSACGGGSTPSTTTAVNVNTTVSNLTVNAGKDMVVIAGAEESWDVTYTNSRASSQVSLSISDTDNSLRLIKTPSNRYVLTISNPTVGDHPFVLTVTIEGAGSRTLSGKVIAKTPETSVTQTLAAASGQITFANGLTLSRTTSVTYAPLDVRMDTLILPDGSEQLFIAYSRAISSGEASQIRLKLPNPNAAAISAAAGRSLGQQFKQGMQNILQQAAVVTGASNVATYWTSKGWYGRTLFGRHRVNDSEEIGIETSTGADWAVSSALYSKEISAQLDSYLGVASPAVAGTVLFIHGYALGVGDYYIPGHVIGGGRSTWSNFPDLIQAGEFNGKKFRVKEFRWSTDTSFRIAADDLVCALIRIKSDTNQKTHIVAHSFGGVLTRVVLQKLNGYKTLCPGSTVPTASFNPSDYIESVATLGSPHSGIADANMLMHGINFPAGQDDVKFEACTQISCHQMGEQITNSAFSASNFWLYDSSSQPGEIAAQLSQLDVFPLPSDIPITAGIGMGIDVQKSVSGAEDLVSLRKGDGLISYAGQRFHPRISTKFGADSLALSLLNCGQNSTSTDVAGSTGVREIILGATGNKSPGMSPYDSSSEVAYFAGYLHASVSSNVAENLNWGVVKFASEPSYLWTHHLYNDYEAGVESCTADRISSCQHASYLLVKAHLDGDRCVMPSLAPTVTGISLGNTAVVGITTTFTVAGRYLPATDHLDITFDGCANIQFVSQSATQHQFTCTPTVAGTLTAVIRTLPGATPLGSFPVAVSAATAPPPTSLNLLLGATVTDSCMFCSNYSVYGDPNYLTDGNITSGRNLGTYSGSFNIFPLSTISIDRLVVYPIMTPNGVVTYEVQTSASPVGAAGTFTSHGIRSSAWASGVPFDILLNVNTTGVRVVKLIIHSSPSWVSFSEIQGFLGNTLATFNDTFETASLDTNLWASASGYGLGTVAGGLLDLAPGAGVSTLGKRLFSGSKIDISTLIKVAGGSAYDTYLNLYDAATNEAINVGEHPGSIGTTGPLGLYAYGSGGYAFTGTNRTPASVSGVSYEYSGVTTTQFKVLNIQIDGNILTVQRGDQSAGGAITYSESFTRNLGRSIVGRQFYLLIANHASGSQNAKVDWIKVATQ